MFWFISEVNPTYGWREMTILVCVARLGWYGTDYMYLHSRL